MNILVLADHESKILYDYYDPNRMKDIDLILLDQLMPQKTGIEFTRELRAGSIASSKDIPIVMITVDSKEKTVLEAKNLGIKEYLVKPISPQALKKRIINAMELK